MIGTVTNTGNILTEMKRVRKLLMKLGLTERVAELDEAIQLSIESASKRMSLSDELGEIAGIFTASVNGFGRFGFEELIWRVSIFTHEYLLSSAGQEQVRTLYEEIINGSN